MSSYTKEQQELLIKYLGTVAMVFNEAEMSYYNDYGFNSDGTLWFKLEGDDWEAEGDMDQSGHLSSESFASDDVDESSLSGVSIFEAMEWLKLWYQE